jgi:pyrimidine-nucleoside phosphorylase
VGTQAGKKVVALLTDMDAPLGAAVGNALETSEAFDVLLGGGPADVVTCTLRLGEEMLELGGVAESSDAARTKLTQAIASGRAARVAERMIEAQGGDPRVVTDRTRLPTAARQVAMESPRDGYVVRVDALAVGLAAVAMGAGRTRADQAVDAAVGLSIDAKPGARVTRGEPLARLHVHRDSDAAPIADRLREAFVIGDVPPPPRPLVLERIATNSTSPRACG